MKQWSRKALEQGIDIRDPEEKRKAECLEGLADLLAQLRTSQEILEGENEELQCAPAKGGSRGRGAVTARAEQVAELERFIGGHRVHVLRLEQVLRLLENDHVTAEQVNASGLRDTVAFYLDSYRDLEGDEAEIYECFPLDKAEDVGLMALRSNKGAKQAKLPAEEPGTPGEVAVSQGSPGPSGTGTSTSVKLGRKTRAAKKEEKAAPLMAAAEPAPASIGPSEPSEPPPPPPPPMPDKSFRPPQMAPRSPWTHGSQPPPPLSPSPMQLSRAAAAAAAAGTGTTPGNTFSGCLTSPVLPPPTVTPTHPGTPTSRSGAWEAGRPDELFAGPDGAAASTPEPAPTRTPPPAAASAAAPIAALALTPTPSHLLRPHPLGSDESTRLHQMQPPPPPPQWIATSPTELEASVAVAEPELAALQNPLSLLSNHQTMAALHQAHPGLHLQSLSNGLRQLQQQYAHAAVFNPQQPVIGSPSSARRGPAIFPGHWETPTSTRGHPPTPPRSATLRESPVPPLDGSPPITQTDELAFATQALHPWSRSRHSSLGASGRGPKIWCSARSPRAQQRTSRSRFGLARSHRSPSCRSVWRTQFARP